jgi:hypothetical protein
MEISRNPIAVLEHREPFPFALGPGHLQGERGLARERGACSRGACSPVLRGSARRDFHDDPPLHLLAALALHGAAHARRPARPAGAARHQPGVHRHDLPALPRLLRLRQRAWLNTATIPPYANTGTARELYDRNQATPQVLDRAAAAADTAHDPVLRKLGNFYASCMDSTRANRVGAAPIANELRLIAAIKTTVDLQREIARLTQVQVYAPFYFSAEVDPKESSRYVGQLYQAGLGLPDREYYLKTDPASDSLRRDYVAHVARTLTLLGTPAAMAEQDAARVLKLETALADSSMTLVAQRDPNAVYHRMTVRELQALAPAIEWPASLDWSAYRPWACWTPRWMCRGPRSCAWERSRLRAARGLARLPALARGADDGTVARRRVLRGHFGFSRGCGPGAAAAGALRHATDDALGEALRRGVCRNGVPPHAQAAGR